MTLYGVPVGKMFHRGAPLLARSRTNIIPCRPLNKDRYVVEGYPALVARRYIGRTKYKADDRRHQTPERADARRALLDVLKGPRLMVDFGLTLDLPDALTDEFAADATADRLDALLCAIQSAWSWTRRDQNFGVPHHADPVEGWVVDPGNLLDRGDKVVSL
jgi:predicted RNase H-like nuclease